MRYNVIALALCLGVAFCTNGVTVWSVVDDFSCFKKSNIVYAMVPAFKNNGEVNPVAKPTLVAAKEAHLLYADIIMNPCTNCKMAPERQVDKMIGALKGLKYGNVWIKVEKADNWSSNTTYNCAYVNALVNRVKKLGKDPGIASEASVWEPIMGNSCTVTADGVGCWWIKHDKEISLDHFKPFGGFTYPGVKEYDGPAKVCGHDVNYNFCNC